MNKVLFCYDGPLSRDENGEYYGSALNNSVFYKYKFFGENVSIAIRIRPIDVENAKRKLSKISNDFRVIELPNTKNLKGLIFYRKKLKRIIKESIINHDFIIIRMPSTVGNIAINYCEKYKKNYIVEMVGCVWDSLWNYGIKGKIVAPISYFQTKRAIKKSNNVIYVTDKFLQTRYPNYNNNIGISDVLLNETNNKILKSRIEKIMNKSNKIVIGTCAALNIKYKGQEYVIKAINELKQQGYNNIEYQLVGGGDSTRLEKIAKKYGVEKQVKIIGSLPHEDVFNWLDSIDVYIQPSFQEGLCRALIEAMSRGLPCIASDVGGNPELISEEWIYNRRKSVKEIVSKIKNINNDTMIKMSKENFNNSKKYQKKVLEKKRKNFYDKIKTNMKIK